MSEAGRLVAALGAAPSRSASIAPAPAPLLEHRVHRLDAVEDLPGASPAAARGSGSATRSKLIGSPYWMVTLGKTSRFQARTLCEPWIATGTTGTPDSSARRPRPGFASPSLPVRERPPSQ